MLKRQRNRIFSHHSLTCRGMSSYENTVTLLKSVDGSLLENIKLKRELDRPVFRRENLIEVIQRIFVFDSKLFICILQNAFICIARLHLRYLAGLFRRHVLGVKLLPFNTFLLFPGKICKIEACWNGLLNFGVFFLLNFFSYLLNILFLGHCDLDIIIAII